MELTEVQAKILDELMRDPRASMRTISDRVGVSTPTVSNMVKELEEMGIIKGYRTELDTFKLGLHIFYIKIDLDLQKIHEIIEGLRTMEYLYALRELDGGGLFLEIVVPSLRVLDETVINIKKMEGVVKLKVSRVTKEFGPMRIISLDAVHDISIDCFYCKKGIEGTPVKFEIDGKKHYVCCDVCASEYKEKYRRVKDRSEL